MRFKIFNSTHATTLVSALACSMALLFGLSVFGGSAYAEYKHDAWPVMQNTDGTYSFTTSGQAKAIGLCAGFYAADVQAREEHASYETAYGTVIKAHAKHMAAAYAAKFKEGQAALDKITLDMTWHFANAAQHGVYQDFRDSAEQACESYAVTNDVVTADYMNSFFEQLTNL